MKTMKCLVVCLFCALLCSCGKQVKNEGIPVVDLSKTVGEIDLKLSDLLENIRVIPLETRPDIWLPGLLPPGNFSIWVGEKYIVRLGYGAMHLFTVDGKYVRKLAQQGGGPEEYPAATSFCVDRQERYGYLTSIVGSICVIDLEQGGVVRKISTGKNMPLKSCYSDKDSTLVYVPVGKNNLDSDIYRIALDGTLLHSIKKNVVSEWPITAYLWGLNDTIRYKMPFCDTLFLLADSVKIPYCRFVTEQPFSMTTGYGRTINVLFENKDRLIFNCDEVRYQKKRNELFQGSSKSCGYYVLDKSDFSLRKLKSFYLDIFDDNDKRSFINIYLPTGKRFAMEIRVKSFKRLLKDKLDNPSIPEYVKELYHRLDEEDNPVLLVGDVK